MWDRFPQCKDMFTFFFSIFCLLNCAFLVLVLAESHIFVVNNISAQYCTFQRAGRFSTGIRLPLENVISGPQNFAHDLLSLLNLMWCEHPWCALLSILWLVQYDMTIFIMDLNTFVQTGDGGWEKYVHWLLRELNCDRPRIHKGVNKAYKVSVQ